MNKNTVRLSAQGTRDMANVTSQSEMKAAVLYFWL